MKITNLTKITPSVPVDEEKPKDGGGMSGKYYATRSSEQGKVYHVDMHSEIADAKEYLSLFKLLDEAEGRDKVIFHLDSPGGYLSTGVRLVNAVKSCEAHITMSVDAPSYSMASILALTGNELVFQPHTFLMFHNYSGGEYGKGGEIRASYEASTKWIYRFFVESCSPFLTEEELQTMMLDQDLYIHDNDKDLSKRIKRHFGGR